MRLRDALLGVGIALLVATPRPAFAMDRNLRSVLVGGGYGLLGGTVIGLASWPLTRDTRSIFIGSSVGLYLGIVVGIYYAIDRDNPENPLRSEAPALPELRPELAATQPPPALLEFQVPVARF